MDKVSLSAFSSESILPSLVLPGDGRIEIDIIESSFKGEM
jgi:hypothetical protein